MLRAGVLPTGIPEGAGQAAGVWVAALLTLAVLSAVVGRNTLSRLAEALFVGVAAGYGASLAWSGVLAPRLALLFASPAAYWYYGVFFALGVLLLGRNLRALAPVASLPLGILVGAGAGLALGGALTGSLVAQVRDTIASLSPASYGGGWTGAGRALDALLVALGVVGVLATYEFIDRSNGRLGGWWQALLRPLQGVGRVFVLVTFGVLLAGALLSFYVMLTSRLDFLIGDWIGSLVRGG